MDVWLFTSPSRARGKELSWLHASRAFVPSRLHSYHLHMHMSCGAEDEGLMTGLEGKGAMVVGQRAAIVRKVYFLFLVCGH
jgi:hypothetical protein